MSKFSVTSCQEQVTFRWDDNDVQFYTRPTCSVGF
jgi:hypothetical protein